MPSLTRRTQSTGSLLLKNKCLQDPRIAQPHQLRRSPRRHRHENVVLSPDSTHCEKKCDLSLSPGEQNGYMSPPLTDVKRQNSISKKNGSAKLGSNDRQKDAKKRLLAELLQLASPTISTPQTPTKKNSKHTVPSFLSSSSTLSTLSTSSTSSSSSSSLMSLSANSTPFGSPIKRRKPKLKYRPASNSVFFLDKYIEEVLRMDVDTADDDDDDLVEQLSKTPKTSRKHSRNNSITDEENQDIQEKAYFLKYSLLNSKKMVFVTGAGVSVAAGIPDFRSTAGLFQSLKKENKVSNGKDLFDFNHVYSNQEETVKFNKMVCSMHQAIQNSTPTQFHSLLNWLGNEQRLKRVYTQNIDGFELRLDNLHTESPLSGKKPFPNVVQLHGSINHMSCFKCHKVFDFDPNIFGTSEDLIEYNEETGEILETQENDHKIVPLCPNCKELEELRVIAGKRSQGIGKLRPRVILYNEFHPDGEQIGDIVSQDISSSPDCLIIAGTTLKIPGVRRMCKEFAKKIHSKNGIVLWINNEVPSKAIQDFLEFIDLIVVGDCQNLSSLLIKDASFGNLQE